MTKQLSVIIDITHVVESTFYKALEFLKNNFIDITFLQDAFTNADEVGNEDIRLDRENYKDIVFNICQDAVRDIVNKQPMQQISYRSRFSKCFEDFYIKLGISTNSEILEELGVLLENHIVIAFYQELCIHIPTIDDNRHYKVISTQKHYQQSNTYSLIFFMFIEEYDNNVTS